MRVQTRRTLRNSSPTSLSPTQIGLGPMGAQGSHKKHFSHLHSSYKSINSWFEICENFEILIINHFRSHVSRKFYWN